MANRMVVTTEIQERAILSNGGDEAFNQLVSDALDILVKETKDKKLAQIKHLGIRYDANEIDEETYLKLLTEATNA
jgi:hypothetical protein